MKIKRKRMDLIKRIKANREIDRCRKMSQDELYAHLRQNIVDTSIDFRLKVCYPLSMKIKSEDDLLKLKGVRDFVEGTVDYFDLPQATRDTLYKYYCESGQMPYGTMKARTGDPDQWIANRLEAVVFNLVS